MRRFAPTNGVSVNACSGMTGHLIAFNVEPDGRQYLLDFAISREVSSGRFAVAPAGYQVSELEAGFHVMKHRREKSRSFQRFLALWFVPSLAEG